MFIRLRRRLRALPVGECVSGVCANLEPRDHCFGGFRPLADNPPKPWHLRSEALRRVFLWRYHGLTPWGSLNKRFVRKIEKNVLLDIYRAGQGGSCDEGNGSSCERGLEDYSTLYWILRERM